MFNTILDIDYIVAALIILIALYVFSKGKYSTVTEANRIFYRMVLCAIVTSIGNLLMNYAATYMYIFSPMAYLLFRMWFNIGTCGISYLGYKYTRMYQNEKKTIILSVSDISVNSVFLIYALLSVVNIFTGIISYVDETGIIHGPLFNITMVMPLLIFIFAFIVLLLNKEDYTRKQLYSILIYFSITFAFVFIELITNNRAPLTMFGVAISLIVIQQSLVSPETLRLAKSLEEAQDAKKEADAANLAKSAFLARMTHDIRTPLNAVIGFNTIIYNESKDKNIKQYASDAKMAGENLLSLINDILDLSKIESGKLELINDEYSFAELVREEYLLFSFKTEEKGLKLVFDVDSSIPSKLIGDEIRIKQIITNLLSNAVKYTETGTITFKVTNKNSEDINENQASISFEVSDTGIGIRPEDISTLFEAFERIDEKRNHKIEGTGLGINICVSLLSMMGSKLMVESEYGQGSKFSFNLVEQVVDATPIGQFDTKKDSQRNETNIALSVSPGTKILVVDDTKINLKVLKGLLTNTKMQVDIAESGKVAIELTLANKYDLIFMDHLMPEMDGIEAMKLIRAQDNGKNHDTAIIALTANAIKGAYEEYMELGFDDVIFKPVRLSELDEVLKKYLNANENV